MKLLLEDSIHSDQGILFNFFYLQLTHIHLGTIADSLNALASYAIAGSLFYWAIKRPDIRHRWIIAIAGVFLIGCGTAYLFRIFSVGFSVDLFNEMISLLAALATVSAAFMLLTLLPQITRYNWDEISKEIQQTNQQLEEKEEVLRQSENALKASEERYQELMNIFDSVIVHENGYIVFANPASVHLLGGEAPEDIEGKKVSDFILPEFVELTNQRFAQVYAGKKTAVIEQKIKRLDGTQVDVEIVSIPHAHNGRPAIQTIARNISNRKQRERELQKSEARFRSVFESRITGKFFSDETDTIVEANDTFLELIGYSRDDLKDKQLNWRYLTPPEYLQQDEAALSTLLSTGTVLPYEKEYIRKDGSRVPVLIGAAIIPDIHQIVAFVLDISHQKATQQKIAESEERFRLVAQATNDILWDMDFTQDKLWWSDALQTIFGYHPDFLAHGFDNWAQLVHPDDRERVVSSIHYAIHQGENQWSAEYRFMKADNVYAYVLDRGYVLRNKEGKTIRMLGSIVDITRTKETLQELEKKQDSLLRSEAKFRQIFESDMVGIFYGDFYGNILDANSSFLNIIGYTREELEQGLIRWANLTPVEYADLDEESLRQMVESKVFKPYEKEYIRKDGTRIPVILCGALLEGHTDLGMGFVLDITERKKAEEKLKYALEELQCRNHELDSYVYKVSHDLRAPLASILGLVNLVKMEKNVQAIEQYIHLIENRVLKLDNFVQSIINHSKTINSEVQISQIDFEQMIREAYDELKYLPNAEKLHLIIHWNKEDRFYSDKLRMNIILKNFLSNAIKFINARADIHFVKFTIAVTPKEAEIVIEDNGMGIEPQYIHKIFDMFFRATEKSDGSGLGLYIVRQAIEKLQGKVTVESINGKGTTFRILLPNSIKQAISETLLLDQELKSDIPTE